MAAGTRNEQARHRAPNDGLTLQTGARVDRYELLEALGSGSFGAVYRARHIHTQQIVALKVLRTEACARPHALDAFMKEARAAASIGHPNIVRVFDCGVSPDGTPFLVMELFDGTDLRTLMDRRGGVLPLPSAIDIACQMLAGLGAAHARGIVHRDVKPANVFVTNERGLDRVRLLDFGISKIIDPDPTAPRTMPGMAIGTPGYMAPEQFGAAHQADARADLYSTAVTLFEMICGRRPFGDVEFAALISKVRFERAPSLAQFAPSLPPAIIAAVDRALARDPDARWPDAAQFAAALRSVAVASIRPVADPSLAPTAYANSVTSFAPQPQAISHVTPREGAFVAPSVSSVATTPIGATRPAWLKPVVYGALGGAALTALTVGAFLWGRSNATDDQPTAIPPNPTFTAQPQSVASAPYMPATAPGWNQGSTTAPSMPLGYVPQPGGPVAMQPPAAVPDLTAPTAVFAQGDGVTLSDLRIVGDVHRPAILTVAQRSTRTIAMCRSPGVRVTVRVQIFVNPDGAVPIAHPYNGAAGDSGPVAIAQCVADSFRDAAQPPWRGAGSGIFDFRADLDSRN